MSQSRLPSLAEFENAEHCVLEDVTCVQETLGDSAASSSLPAREISDEFVIRDTLRGRRTSVRLFAEGWADIELKCRGQSARHLRFNLSFLDPVPVKSLVYPELLLKVAGVFAVLTGIAAAGLGLEIYPEYALQATIVSGAATLAALCVVFYGSNQRIVFRTLHGRADAMRFQSGLGTGYRLRWRLPRLVRAIRAAAASADDDTATYLRAEMREHYRLRNDGVLTDDECSAATGQILGNFDGPL